MSTPDPDTNYNELCLAVSHCRSGCDKMRKVVSHVFGRNKICTRQIPEACTISWCRQHYQRFRYRCKENWIHTQIDIIRRQLGRMEQWGGVRSWTIIWGKSVKEAIDLENALAAQMLNDASHNQNAAEFTANNQDRTANAIEEPFKENQVPTSSFQSLVGHIGAGKTFEEVYSTVDAIEKWAESPNGYGHQFPQIEFLPDIDEERYPPAGGRKKPRRQQKPLSPAVVGSSSSPTVASALMSPITGSSQSPRKNGKRGVKRSHTRAFEDDSSDALTKDDATTKKHPSPKRRQLQASRPTAASKAGKGSKDTKKNPARKKIEGL
ncbi:hypothetical protein MMC29_001191 [Sticta canariensis]|nr:hypothetical protein [Sticta canariensis]